jgi:hypothetical protein
MGDRPQEALGGSLLAQTTEDTDPGNVHSTQQATYASVPGTGADNGHEIAAAPSPATQGQGGGRRRGGGSTGTSVTPAARG